MLQKEGTERQTNEDRENDIQADKYRQATLNDTYGILHCSSCRLTDIQIDVQEVRQAFKKINLR